MRRITRLHAKTGSKIGCVVRAWVRDSIFFPLFWSTKVMVTKWARLEKAESNGEILERVEFLRAKTMLPIVSNFVLPRLSTVTYSQLRMA
jgi:hypothetical protein